MKIAMIGHKRVPSREGGVEIHVEELSTRLADMGHEVIVYNRSKKLSSEEKKQSQKYYKGVRIKTIPTINTKSLDAVIYSFFASVLALFHHPDVIHYHAIGPSVMLFIPHLFGIKTVATVHGLNWKSPKWGKFGKWYMKLGERIIAKYADKVIVLSSNTQAYFRNTYGRETIFIPNGVSEPEIRKADIIEKKYGLKKGEYFLFLARIVPEKGLHYLLEAFSKIKTDKKLVIAGAGSHTGEYVDKISKMAGNDKRVVMTGFVQGTELDELYSNTHLYVLPSDSEGMPIGLLEAMSYGCCCLVSDIPESAEVVEDSGYTFQKGNVADLKTKLETLLQDESLAGIGTKAQKLVLEKYNWDSIVSYLVNECYKG